MEEYIPRYQAQGRGTTRISRRAVSDLVEQSQGRLGIALRYGEHPGEQRIARGSKTVEDTFDLRERNTDQLPPIHRTEPLPRCEP